MKSTTVQTLNALRMCGTTNWWAGLGYEYAFTRDTHASMLFVESVTWAS